MAHNGKHALLLSEWIKNIFFTVYILSDKHCGCVERVGRKVVWPERIEECCVELEIHALKPAHEEEPVLSFSNLNVKICEILCIVLYGIVFYCIFVLWYFTIHLIIYLFFSQSFFLTLSKRCYSNKVHECFSLSVSVCVQRYIRRLRLTLTDTSSGQDAASKVNLSLCVTRGWTRVSAIC